MAAWFYNAVSTAATTLPLGVHLYWQEWSSELLPYWLGTYAVLLMSWLAPCVFFEALERTGATAKWRLQPNKSPLPDSVKAQALRMAGLNWCWLPFALLFASPLLQLRFALETPAHWWWSFPAQILASFVVDDIWFYAYHRYLHEHPKLYILYHKPHHVFTAPCAWTSHAVHPVEMLLQSVGTMAGPLLFAFSLPQLWIWMALRQLQGVLDHIGIDCPFDPLHYIPGVGGTVFHDDHHRVFTKNYASCFSVIDDVFGTRHHPEESELERVRGEKAAASGVLGLGSVG